VQAEARLVERLRERDQFESEKENRRRFVSWTVHTTPMLAHRLEFPAASVRCRCMRREVVLGKLDRIAKEFVYKVSIKKGLPEVILRERPAARSSRSGPTAWACTVPVSSEHAPVAGGRRWPRARR
jgi:hypothetical protein